MYSFCTCNHFITDFIIKILIIKFPVLSISFKIISVFIFYKTQTTIICLDWVDLTGVGLFGLS